jgi:hypothetical protein
MPVVLCLLSQRSYESVNRNTYFFDWRLLKHRYCVVIWFAGHPLHCIGATCCQAPHQHPASRGR